MIGVFGFVFIHGLVYKVCVVVAIVYLYFVVVCLFVCLFLSLLDLS